MMQIQTFSLLIVCFQVESARILAIFPLTVRSHFRFNEAIIESLHAVGHEITIFSPFAPKSSENITYVNALSSNITTYKDIPISFFSNMNMLQLLRLGMKFEARMCDHVLNLPFMRDVVKSDEKLFDLIIIQLFYLPQCYYPLASKFRIPIIGTVPYRSWKPADSIMGLSHHPAKLPVEISALQSVTTFKDRFLNMWYDIIVDILCKIEGGFLLRQIYEKYFPDYNAGIHNNIQPSILFINNHYSLMKRPLNSNTFEVGGVHIEPAKPLNQTNNGFASFINEAPHGVILFSLGSLLHASSLPDNQRDAFIKAFANIPQRVIWKYEDELEGISDNVMLSNWVPQRDILEHKNVKAFISHCGINGVHEAIYTATPIISTPIFIDQTANAVLLENLGVAVRLDLSSITPENVLDALDVVLNNTRYFQNMQELSQKFKERPMSAQDSVVYWTNYVLNFKGAHHLRDEHQNMPLYQYLLLDVLTFTIFSIVLLSYLVIRILRKIFTTLKNLRNFFKNEQKEKKY